MSWTVLLRSTSVASLIALSAVAAPAAATDRAPAPKVVADGMFNPRGIDAGPGERLLVAEVGSGELTEIRTHRKPPLIANFATLPSDPDRQLGPVDVAFAGHDRAYVLQAGPPESTDEPFGELRLVRRGGGSSLVADIAQYQQGDPDPDDLEGFPEESNPNGLALVRGSNILVADAAGNDLLLIDRRGRITTVARFKPEEVPFPEGLPFGPPPGTPVPAESVPTAVAVGPDGAWYVSELKGFPFAKGTSRIWRIEPGSVGATCDPSRPHRGRCRTVARGFTSVIDLAFGDRGTMYVLEIVKEGLLGPEVFGTPPIGALWAVRHGSKTELAPGSLLAPGGVTLGRHGALYVTTGTFLGPGEGTVVRIGKERRHGDDDDHHHDDDEGKHDD